MAERRMFAKTIIDSDAFLDMPQTTQLLYFHLSMRADDDGFINNAKSIMRNVKCSDDDLKLLAVKKFIIPFETGIVVIKHWKIHNYIRKDRYSQTKCQDELSLLNLDENNAYTLEKEERLTDGIPLVNERSTQVRIGKDRIGKDSIDKDNNKELLLLFEELGFGTINSINAAELIELEKEYTTEWAKEAFKEANNAGIRNLKYVNGILKNWKTKGFKAEKIKHKNNDNTKGFNNFEPRSYDYDDLEKKLLGWDKDE